MDKNQTHPTVEQQILVSAAAEEILQTCSIHQQALVRMLAVAEEHKLNAANLISDLSQEMKSATAAKIEMVAERLESDESIENALAQVPDAIPEPALMALSVVRDRGLQQPLNRALLNTIDLDQQHPANADDFNLIDSISGLEKKVVFVFAIITFVMLFIVPQFRAMYEEFGIELPYSMQLFSALSNLFSKFWFVFALIIIAIGINLILKRPRMITNYFTRWIPSRWQQPVFTATAQKEISLSWVAQASDNSNDVALRYVNNRRKGVRESKRVAAAEKIQSSTDVWETLASEQMISRRASKVVSASSGGQSAAWILRQMACDKSTKSDQRNYSRIRLLVWLGEFFLMFVGGWLAIAIFQCLLTIIRGLTGYV